MQRINLKNFVISKFGRSIKFSFLFSFIFGSDFDNTQIYCTVDTVALCYWVSTDNSPFFLQFGC